MKLNRTFIIAVSVAVFLVAAASCKKYEEGPLLSFRSSEGRIENRWKFTLCIVDGEDKTPDYEQARLEFSDYGGFKFQDPDGYIARGEWTLSGSKERVKISYRFSDSYIYGGMWMQESVNAAGELDILRLKNRECILEGPLTIVQEASWPGGSYHETLQHEVRWELEEE